MKMSEKGFCFLAELEAVVLTPYKDSKGIWTVGVGHTAAAGPPDPRNNLPPMSLDEALQLYRRDLERYEEAVSRAVKWKVKQHQFDALVSFHFNTGAIRKATLTRKLNAGDVKGAGAAFLNWLKPVEITERRMAEYKLFTTGNYGEPFLVRVYKRKPGKPTIVEIKES